jgi:hypothetical protein
MVTKIIVGLLKTLIYKHKFIETFFHSKIL